MAQLDIDALQNELMQQMTEQAEKEIRRQVEYLIAMIKVETKVMNEELANNTQQRGYDFKSIPEALVDSIKIETKERTNKGITMQAVFDSHVLDQCSDSLMDFFYEYVFGNAHTRYKRG